MEMVACGGYGSLIPKTGGATSTGEPDHSPGQGSVPPSTTDHCRNGRASNELVANAAGV